jgi:TRAP-type uncharacterized transport system fused permease subunit
MTSVSEGVYTAVKATIGAAALSAGVVGFVKRPLSGLERLAAFAAAFLLIKPGWITDVIGAVIVVILLLLQRKKKAA